MGCVVVSICRQASDQADGLKNGLKKVHGLLNDSGHAV